MLMNKTSLCWLFFNTVTGSLNVNVLLFSFLGNIVPTATIYQNLKYIIEDSAPAPNFPVAALTSENRDSWASMRHALEAIPGNEEVLKLIDSAVFVLCLDDHDVSSIADVTRTFLHGDGRNR